MHTVPSDAALVAALRGGDDTAFDQIHERYARELLGYARQVLGGAHHDAEEVVQDAFMRALASLRKSDRPMALRAWLYTIVRNRALDELRKPHRRRLEDELEQLKLADPRPASDPFQSLLRRDALDGIVAAINELPERQRTALVLRELDDRSHDEVAGTLGISRGASKTLLHRAKANLALAA
jgi:RNA polymerase sigma-70 factor (ECF subfamily)